MKTQTNGPLNPHHWYDPIVEAEHKVADYLVDDVKHTLDDMDHLDRAMHKAGKKHPVFYSTVKTVFFIVALLGLLLAQAYHASRMP